eukprot:439005-Rhodomonas_salina.1
MPALHYVWELQRQGEVKCYRLRVLLVGSAEAGKTSLLRALMREGVTEEIAKDDRTVGIDM